MMDQNIELCKRKTKVFSKLDINNKTYNKFERSNINVTFSKFTRIGIRKAIITNSNITQCLLTDIYARNATFENVNFTGTTFIDCDFSLAIFNNCVFEYCKFHNCLLAEKQIEKCLPTHWNLRKELANNLKTNFKMIGHKEKADEFLKIEIISRQRELLEIVFSNDLHYQKYNCFSRAEKLMEFLRNYIMYRVTGYGINLKNIFASYIIIIFLLSCISWMIKTGCEIRCFWEFILIGFAQSLNSSDFLINGYCSNSIWLFILIMRLIGIIYLAILTATIYRKISK